MRQLQASSSLFYEVFRTYDPGNQLLSQAQSEVLQQELELQRLQQTLQRLQALPMDVAHLAAASPFAFPLLVQRLREQLSTEKLKARLDRLLADSESALAPPANRKRKEKNEKRESIPNRRRLVEAPSLQGPLEYLWPECFWLVGWWAGGSQALMCAASAATRSTFFHFIRHPAAGLRPWPVLFAPAHLYC